MKKISIYFALAMFIGIAGAARGADILQPNPENPNVTVGSLDNFKNLYTAGASVTINGNTAGDLVAAGGMITLTGNVEQDVILAGGSLNLSGQIGGDARLAGGNISISAPVAGDLAIAGGNVNLSDKTLVSGDLLLAVGNGTVDSPVAGSAKIVGGNVFINSKIEGNVYVTGTDRLVFGPKAEILGKVVHKGPKRAVIQEGAKVPVLEYTEFAGRGFKHTLRFLFTVGFALKLLAWIAVGLLLVRFKKTLVAEVFEAVKAKPWANLGWGLIGAVAIPLAVLLLFFSVVGYYVAFLAGIGYVLMFLFTNILAATVLGVWAIKFFSKTEETAVNWQAAVVGVVIYQLLIKLVPFAGLLAIAIFFLMCFGAQLKMLKDKFIVKN